MSEDQSGTSPAYDLSRGDNPSETGTPPVGGPVPQVGTGNPNVSGPAPTRDTIADQLRAASGGTGSDAIDLDALADQIARLSVDDRQAVQDKAQAQTAVQDTAASDMDTCNQCGKSDGLRVQARDDGSIYLLCVHDGTVQDPSWIKKNE